MKKRIISSAFALLFSVSTSAAIADVSRQQTAVINARIQQLVADYAITRDNLDAVSYSNTFAEDGAIVLFGETYKGREVLKKRIEASDPNVVTIHMMGPGQINVVDNNTATGVQYVVVYRGIKGESHKEGSPLPITNLMVVGKYHDRYVNTDDGWKFSERRFEAVFTPR